MMEKMPLYNALPNPKTVMLMKKRERSVLALNVVFFIILIISILAINVIDNGYLIGKLAIFILISPFIIGTLLHSLIMMRTNRKYRIQIYKDRIILPPSRIIHSILKKPQVVLFSQMEKIYWNQKQPLLKKQEQAYDPRTATISSFKGLGPVGYYNMEKAVAEKAARNILITFKRPKNSFYTPIEIKKGHIYDERKFRETLKRTGLLEERQKMILEKYIKINRKHHRKKLPTPSKT